MINSDKYRTIREYGRIYIGNRKDEFDKVFLSKETFENLRKFVAENTNENTEIEQAFTYHLQKDSPWISVKNLVGVIETKDGTFIEILPKIYNNSDKIEPDKIIENNRRIFLRMLSCLKNSPFKEISEAHIKSSKFPIFEIFISSFLSELEEVFKRGLKQYYVKNRENQKFLKGKLIFQEHIRHNFLHKERFFVEFDEFTTDIPQNRLIKTALLHLEKKSKLSQNVNNIRKFIAIFDEINISQNITKDFNNISTQNRLYSHYDKILKWVRVFLLNESFTNFKGIHLNKAILFPMEKIFEDYVSTGFKKYLTDFEIRTQDRVHHLIDKPKSFGLKPDIVAIKNNGENNGEKNVIDIKWKIIDRNMKNYNISQADLYQMFAYGKKYEIDKTEKPSLMLIYPMSETFKEENSIEFLYETNLLLKIIPFNLTEKLEKEVAKCKNHLNFIYKSG